MEAHIASVVIVKPTVQELKVTGLKKPIAMFFILACICLHPRDKKKKLNLTDTMIPQLNVHKWGRSSHTWSTMTRFGHLGGTNYKSQTIL